MKKWTVSVGLGLVLLATGASAAPPSTGADSDMRVMIWASALGLDKAADVEVRNDQVSTRTDKFEIHKMTLYNRYAGNIHLRVRVPLSSGQHPALFLANGVSNGDASFLFYDFKEDAELVELEYPYNGKRQGLALVEEVLRSSWRSELQMATALVWLSQRKEVNADKISIVNVSLGTFYAPLAIRLAQVFGVHPYATVFAFGGADLESLVHAFAAGFISQADYKNIRKPLTEILQIAEPAQHLAHLQGQFLVINGTLDQIIPSESTHALEEGLPNPKKIISLDSGHITSNNPKLIHKTITTVHDWLISIGALDSK